MKKIFALILLSTIVLICGCIGGGNEKISQEIVENPSQVVMSPFGPLPKTDANGKDLEGIGRYDGMIRVEYQENSYDYEEDISVTYYKEGDVFNEAKDYFVSKIKGLGYKMESSSYGSISYPGFQIVNGYHATFTKDNENIDLDIMVMRINDKDYTIANIYYCKYKSQDSTSENSNQESQNSQEEYSEFNNYKEATIYDDNVKEADNLIRPILKDAIGDVKLKNYYSSGDGVFLSYISKNEIKKENIDKIVNELLKLGYKVFGQDTTEHDYQITLISEDSKNMDIVLQGEYDSNEITIFFGNIL